MIKKLISTTILIIIAIMFAGCGTPSFPDQAVTPTGQITTQPAGTGSGLDKSASVTVSEADQAAYGGAFELNDLAYCDKIDDEELKKECKTAVQDKIALETAIANKDASECNKLSTEDKKEACKINVEAELQAEKEKDEKETQTQTDSDLAAQLTESGDHKRCSEIVDGNQAFYCEVQVLVNKAINEQDSEICNLGSSNEIKAKCLEDYENVENTAELQQ